MAQRAGLTQKQIIDAAIAIADAGGMEAVTLTSVAARLGVRPPSLYTHVDGIGGLHRAMALVAGRDLIAFLRSAAGRGTGRHTLRAMAHAYRRFARQHPGCYAALLPRVGEQEDPQITAVVEEIVMLVGAALVQEGIPAGEAMVVIRCLRSGVHGFVTLEAERAFRFPLDADESFEALVATLVEGTLARYRPAAGSPPP